jgi:predicted phosphodiesterase
MRAAVFSDVHGNLTALEAVLAGARDACADEFWVVGDLVAHGPQPAATLRRLMGLPNGRFVRGNTDRYVLTGELPGMIPAPDTARTTAEVQLLVDATRSFCWTRGAVTAAGFDWLAALAVEDRTTLPDGTRVLLVHASPGHDDGRGVQPTMSDRELRAAELADAGAALIFVGHTHVPVDYTIDGVRVVNLGSVSMPATAERRAMWTLLVADESGYTVERRFADYDQAAVIAALDREHHPSATWIKTKFTD